MKVVNFIEDYVIVKCFFFVSGGSFNRLCGLIVHIRIHLD